MATRDELVRHIHDLAQDTVVNEQPELAKPSASTELSKQGMTLVLQFETSNGQLADGEDVDHAVERFMNWLDRRRVYGLMTDSTDVLVSLTRKYGKIDVTIGYTRTLMSKDPKSVRIAREMLTIEVEKAHDVYASKSLPQVEPSLAASRNQRTEETPIVEFDPTRISKKVDDGKVFFRVHGGQWSKWGVPIYDEVLKASGISTENFPDTGIALSGKKAFAEIVKGQPKRITRLEDRV